ncbi:MAG: hypothetical protein IPP42_01060 [Saprospiraceae bacterium]|nr:hypothetical protein [Saprospiraceae bacterium]
MNGKTREATEAFSKFITRGQDQNMITLAQNELDGIEQMGVLFLAF